MPTLSDTKELLETEFINGWGVTTRIKVEGMPFDDSSDSEYVSLSFINYVSNNAHVGSSIVKRIRHTGVLSVKVYIKQNIGTGSAYAFADQISEIMSNKMWNNLFTKASITRKNGATESGWFGLIIDIPYISDEE